MHRYCLQPYKGNNRYYCPQCNHKTKTFSRYIDLTTGQQLADNVGRCSRENNCGYHFSPSAHFKLRGNRADTDFSHGACLGLTNYNNTILKKNNIHNIYSNYKPLNGNAEPSYIPPVIVEQSYSVEAYKQNNFVNYLIKLFGFDKADELVGRYRIGNSKHWQGATVFWQIDEQSIARAGKIMLYDSCTGKRIKQPYNHITWVHSLLKQQLKEKIPKVLDSDMLSLFESFNLKQCLFGQHLLPANPLMQVAIVESEKTAIIASMFFPQLLWLATGGIGNLNAENCKVLQGRKVYLFPDVNAYDKWQQKVTAITLKIPGTTFKVFKVLESLANTDEIKSGLDLSDLLIKQFTR